MDMKPGRTFEAMGYKLVQTISWQFSPDISVGDTHMHSMDFTNWQIMVDTKPTRMPNTNKNRHYRNEENSLLVMTGKDGIVQYLEDVRDSRDGHPDKETKIGNADSKMYICLRQKYNPVHSIHPSVVLVFIQSCIVLFVHQSVVRLLLLLL